MYKWKLLLSLSLSVLVGLTIGWYSLAINNFAVTPDIAGLACAANGIAETGQPRNYPIPPGGYEMCWFKDTYPALQYIHAALLMALPVEPTTLVLFTTILGYLGCIVGVWLLVRLITKSDWLALLGGFLAATTPALARSLVLTPQNLFGYTLLLAALCCLIVYAQHKRWWWPLIAALIIGFTNFIHDLSFGVGAIVLALWVCLVWFERWYWKVGLLSAGALAFASQLWLHWLPASLGEKIDFFLNSDFGGIDHPWWDHPAIWGYLLLALGIVGLCNAKLNNAQRTTFLIMMLVPFLLGHASALGIGLLPNRFIPFSWLALTPLAALGLNFIVQTQVLPMWVQGSLVGIVLVSQLLHAGMFIQDDVTGWAYRYRPRTGYEDALRWLNTYDDDAELLGVQGAENQEILIAPLWYKGHTTYYPWYALNHHDIKDFSVINPASSYASIVSNPADANYTWLHNLYLIVAKPNATETATALAQANVQYFILPKSSKVYTQVWGKLDGEQYPVIYESDTYVIYEL